ncbi:MAG: DNA primase [Candidatus Saganbacteria bacterium]|nr:DNA primase [Candidatus Saganbacteria bacterium]
MINPAIIEEIRNKADIVTIISEYVPIKKRGKNYLGLCPFHPEKKPSFTVSPEKQLFHCFGCGEGGNIFAFIMKIENMDFVDAAELLGRKLGMEVKGAERLSSKEKSEREKLYEVIGASTSFFERNLPIEKAAEYIKKRGIGPETVETFRLGYAPEGWDNLFKYLLGKGFHPDQIVRAGLALKKENEEGYYDRFRGRLIFPIFNLNGRVVAFGGRTLGDEEPKYLNSPDSPIYSKGDILFGLNLSKEQIKKDGRAIIVEGYMDLIACARAGLKISTATLGTALTLNQAKLLQRFAKEVVLAFDCDSAGGTATERSIELLRGLGLAVRVAEIKEGKDPDEYIKQKGGAAFEDAVNSAITWIEFKINRILSRHKIEVIEDKAAAIREVAELLSKEKDNIVQKEYVNMASALLKTDAETIGSEIKRISYYTGSLAKNRGLQRVTEKPTSKLIEAEKCLIRLALESEGALAEIKEKISPEELTGNAVKDIFRAMISKDVPFEALQHKVLEEVGEEERKILSRILLEEGPPLSREKILTDCIDTIKGCHLKNVLDSLRSKIEGEEKAGNFEKVKILHKEFEELSGALRGLKKTA